MCSETALTLLEESLTALGETHDGLRAQLLGRLAEELSLSEQHERRLSFARLAVTLARQNRDPAVLATVLKSTYWALWIPEELEQRKAVAEEIIRLATELGNRALVLEGRVFRLLTFLERGDVAAARRDLDTCERLAQQLKQPYYRWVVAVVRGCTALMEGRLNDAERLVQEALKLTDQAQNPNAALLFGVQWGHLLWLRGRVHEIETLLDGLASLSPVLHHVIRCVLASLYCELGRLAEARNEFERLAARDFADLPRDVTWTYSMAVLCGLCGSLGDAVRARPLYEALCPYSDRIVILGPAVGFGSVSYCLGQLATALSDWEAATRHFDEALAVHRRLGMGHWLALTQVEYARMLLLQGQPEKREQAEALLSSAIHAATEMELPAVAARARSVLAAAAKAPPAPRADTPLDRGRPSAETVPETRGEDDRAVSSEALFRREGEFWTLAFEGKVIHLKDVVGLRYICELLRRPAEPVPVTLLYAAVRGGRASEDWPPNDIVDAEDLSLVELGNDDCALDARAVVDYRSRWIVARQELNQARKRNDLGEIAKLQQEIDFLTEALANSWGRWKELPETKRVRLCVTKAVASALKRIRGEHPRLGRHLDTHLKRGYVCIYYPGPDPPVRWRF